MSLLKWYRPQAGDTNQQKVGKWIDSYARSLMDRLRANKNLADVEDRAKARENLELTGNNNETHYHDSRYVPMIQEEATIRSCEDNKLREYIDKRIASIEKEIKLAMDDIRSGL